MVTTVAEAEIVGKNNEAAFKPLFLWNLISDQVS